MFTFFRRYQRIIYFIITAVIILSFSFFGTYSAFTSGKGDDPVVFRTEDGKKVTRSEFSEYVHFLSTDSLSIGDGASSGNVLNDGVIPNDIIATGIGEVLVHRFIEDFRGDLVTKLRRERNFQPYRHPQASFLSAMQVWSYFAPDIKDALEKFRATVTDDPAEIYSAKATLYLAERQFPAVFLRQILAYQQQQYNWLEPDVALEGRPLGLFGYNQLSDWFGVSLIDKSCEFIIQTASRARAAGLSVSSGEALASLYQNAQKALQRFPQKSGMTADDLFRNALRELNIDQSRAIAIWSDVLLFRRALIELPLNIVVNTQPFDDHLRGESEACDLECYQLQPSFRCSSIRDLLKIEAWLQGISVRKSGASLLMPPETFHSAEEVLSSWPEFVERKFIVSLGSVTFDDVAKNIRLRDLWNWEVKEENWDLLVAEIPSLGAKEAIDRNDRGRALDGLATQLRTKADTIAKENIVKAHPEWMKKALAECKMDSQALNIRMKGKTPPLKGIDDRQALINELAQAPIGEQSPSLDGYTQDGKHFYRIQVLDREPKDSLASLPDLLADGTLDGVVDRLLEIAYPKIRTERPADYRKENGEWKSFHEVKDKVGEAYFAPLFKDLDQAIVEWSEKLPSYCHWDDVKSARVAVRFLPQLNHLFASVEKGGNEDSHVTQVFLPTAKETTSLSIEERPLRELWLLVPSKQRFFRREAIEKPQFLGALSLDVGTWMLPKYSQEFGPFVAKVEKKDIEPYSDDLRVAVYGCQRSLGREAIKARSQQLTVDFFGEHISQK